MDAIKFIRERNRMCHYYYHDLSCNNCPAIHASCADIEDMEKDENIVLIVEKWSEENPSETRQSRFLEQWQEAELDADGVLKICPASLCVSYRAPDGGCGDALRRCFDCCHEFWGQEVE